MMQSSMGNLVEAIRKLARSEALDDQADGHLLSRFVNDRDEAAFQTLVQRHGPSVLGLCRRMLGDAHLAEDAFQATFLVLVRRAASIVRQETVGCWLSGVAYRVALRARHDMVRQQTNEQSYANMTKPSETKADPEMGAVLEQELQRLPEKYRAPLLLCYLEGKTKSEAARQLGWSDGAVHGRLERAREKLRTRLTKRGIALSAPALFPLLSNHAAPAAVPVALLDTTTRSALLFLTGRLAAGLISIQVLCLAEGVLKTMWVTKMKLSLSVLALVTIVVAGATNLVVRIGAAEPAADKAKPLAIADVPPAREGPKRIGAAEPAADKAKPLAIADVPPAREGPKVDVLKQLNYCEVSDVEFADNAHLLTMVHWPTRSESIQVWDLTSGKEAFPAISPPRAPYFIKWMKVTADGNTLAFGTSDHVMRQIGEADPSRLYLFRVGTGKEIVSLEADVDSSGFAFSRDGKSARFLARRPMKEGKKNDTLRYDNYLIETNSGKVREKKPLEIPPDATGASLIGQDGKTLLVASKKGELYGLELFDAATGKEQVQIEIRQEPRRSVLSPDGSILAVAVLDSDRWKCDDSNIYLWDAATGKSIGQFLSEKQDQANSGLAFTPDGKRLISSVFYKGGILQDATRQAREGVKIWDIASGKKLSEFKHGGWWGRVPWICSPTHPWIAYVANDQSVRLCEIDTGKELRKFTGQANAESTFPAFSPDGKTLAAGWNGRSDQTIRLWNVYEKIEK